ncbi:hypothetical protein ABZX12_26175 [Kribbella sp. NPDC003505]|uniref:hypothetical protein n=1 Tax=Kribbella sp. NPDC003505 TaxID=3154448 RepID=UPI0033B01834
MRWSITTAAALWALLFAGGSFYTALGGEAGGKMIAPDLANRVLADDPAMIRLLWITGGLKTALAIALIVAVRLKNRSGTSVRFWGISGRLMQLLGVGIGGWGVAEGTVGLLVVVDAMAPPEGWGDGSVAKFYAAVWGPYWLLGGILYFLAGRLLCTHGRTPDLSVAEGKL